jgi:predicted kinase
MRCLLNDGFRQEHDEEWAAVAAERLPALYIITGIMASGKSTVAEMLAQRLEPGVHVRGDVFRRMVVAGRAEMAPDPSPEALRQLDLRYRLTAQVAEVYREVGFNVVVQDIYLGDGLRRIVELVRSRPLYVVVLCPRPDVVAAREAARGKAAYGTWSVGQLDTILRTQTQRLGLWVDNSDQRPEQTVDEVLRRAPAEARVG